MSQAPPFTPRDPFAPEVPAEEPRVSGLAIASFVTSLLCCIPGVGAIAAVLGIGAIVSISHSRGRLSGRTLAFVAVALGVLGTVLWIGVMIGASRMVAWFQPYQATVTAIEAGDWATARGQLTPGAAAIPDERFEAFRDEYRKTYGNFADFPQGLGGLFKGYMAVGPGMQSVNQAQSTYPNRNAVPLPANFANGPGVVIFVMNESQMANARPALENIGIAGQGTGIVWLVDPAATPAPAPPPPP